LFFISIASLTFVYKRKTKVVRLPPGPKGCPVFGFLPMLGNNHHTLFRDLAKTYGPIVGVKFGTSYIVVLNDFASIKEALCHKALQSRTKSVLLEESGCPGIATLNGQSWSDNRSLSLRLLRGLGWGTSTMESDIKEEARCLVEVFTALNGAPILIRKYSMSSISNYITRLLFGVRYEYDDPVRVRLNTWFNSTGKLLSQRTLVLSIPAGLYKILGWIPFTDRRVVRSAMGKLVNFVREQIQKHQSASHDHMGGDYIDGYLKKITEYKSISKTSISLEYLPGNLLNLFGAGTNSLNRSLAWHLLLCADQPETLQRKIQNEIDDVVGRERQPSWEDSHKMPFTMASIREMQRWKTVMPLGIPRSSDQEILIGGYVIPKGAVVMANLWAVHMDPNLWKSPEKFDPARFLDERTLRLMPKPEHLIPFSIGD
ncbi:unnamed protein product, partial [Ixodes hexagonus]